MAKKTIIEHAKKNAAQPLFMYLAYDAPHAVLELPTQAYPAGTGLNGGLQWLNKPGRMINTATGIVDSYVYPEYRDATYDDDNNAATPEVAWPDTYKRYATAVTRIDDAVGDIMQLLKDLKIDDNTLVVFTSDNGPSIESYLPAKFVANKPTFFESFGPFDGIKRDCWEGGLRMPTIARWPANIAPGKVVTTPSMLSDWLATFADAAQLQPPARTDGVSLMPALKGKGEQLESKVYVEYYEGGNTPRFDAFEPSRRGEKRGQMQMVRMGDYVGVRYNIQSANEDFEIFNVVNDPGQTVNLARRASFDKLQALLKAKVLQVRSAERSAPRPYDSAFIPATEVKGNPVFNWKFFEGNFPYVVSEKGLKTTKKVKAKDINLEHETNKNGLLVYEGFIKADADGKYVLSFQSPVKAYVRLHDASLFDADYGYEPGTPLTQEVYLKAGFHPVKIYLLKHAGASGEVSLILKPVTLR
jgi:arylsulfatase A-like enzyme